MKYRKSSLFPVALMFLVMLGAAFVTIPSVSAYTITVDGDPADWLADTSGQAENTGMYYAGGPPGGEYVWRDELGDDTGNGTYTYPTTFTGDEGDLLEFRITWDADYVFFLFRMADIVPGQWNRTYISLAIDQDQIPGSGAEWIYGVTETWTADEARYEYCFVNIGGDLDRWAIRPCVMKPWEIICDQATGLLIANNSDTNCFEVGVPTAAIGYPGGKIWRYTLIVCLHDWETTIDTGQALPAEVHATAGPHDPGGGIDTEGDPDVFDAAFYPSKAAQEADLGDWEDGEWVEDPPGSGNWVYTGKYCDVNAYQDVGKLLGVGGALAQINKFKLLAPWIGLASTTIIVAVATTLYVKRVKSRKEK